MKKTSADPPKSAISSFDVVAIAASAGGLNAINVVPSNLPTMFPATIVVVKHLDPWHHSLTA